MKVGFLMNFVMLALVYSTIEAPAARSSIDPAAFAAVLGASTNIVLASLAAYAVSQNWDVIVFHRLKAYTDGDHLWLRNICSTASSQAIDTVIFVAGAFLVVPTVLGTGVVLPRPVVLQLAVGQYLLKPVIALVDTPFVYLIVNAVRNSEQSRGTPT